MLRIENRLGHEKREFWKMSSAASQGPVPGAAAASGLRDVAWPRGNGPPGKQQGTTGNRILAAGQHQGSTSAIRTALNALVAN
jgi:hypothetical protein